MRRKIEYPEQDKLLYRFQLNEEGYVERLEPISKWNFSGYSQSRIIFKAGSTESSISRDNMDKPLKGRIYTFVDDKPRAEALIKNSLKKKLEAAEEEVNKVKKALDALKF